MERGSHTTVTRAIVLPCPREEAWDRLTDWERQAGWMADADRVRVLSPRRGGLGVRLAVRTRVLGLPLLTETLEVTGWAPPARLVVRHGGPVQGTGTWLLEEAGDGTRFTWTEEVRVAVPVVGTLAARCYRPVLGMLMGRSVRALRRAVIAAGPLRVRPDRRDERAAYTGGRTSTGSSERPG